MAQQESSVISSMAVSGACMADCDVSAVVDNGLT